MASAEQVPEWIAANARQRRLLMAALFAGVLLHGLIYFNQRAIFMPWNPAEHPRVVPTPSAFFAQVPAVGAVRDPAAVRFATLARPVALFSAPQATPDATPAGGIGGGTEGGAIAPDGGAAGQSAGPPAALAGAGNPAGSGLDTGGPGAPLSAGGAPSAADAPAAVPEAGTWAMLLLGLGLIAGAMRRRLGVAVS